jgi:hypothetical protein
MTFCPDWSYWLPAEAGMAGLAHQLSVVSSRPTSAQLLPLACRIYRPRPPRTSTMVLTNALSRRARGHKRLLCCRYAKVPTLVGRYWRYPAIAMAQKAILLQSHTCSDGLCYEADAGSRCKALVGAGNPQMPVGAAPPATPAGSAASGTDRIRPSTTAALATGCASERCKSA